MNPGLAPCLECPHRRGLHKGGGPCSVEGCGCPVFRGEPEPPEGPLVEGRVVQVAVPDGYSVTITLTPIPEVQE